MNSFLKMFSFKQGDSGGPLVGSFNKGTMIQVGIVSYSGIKCEDPESPPVFVNLTNPDIKSFISKNRSPSLTNLS